MFRWIRKKLWEIWDWLRDYILDPSMVLWIVVAEILFWGPAIAGAVLGIVVNGWFWTVATVYVAFWFGPFTPAIPLQIALAVALKRIFYVDKTIVWAIGKWKKSRYYSENGKRRVRERYRFVTYKKRIPEAEKERIRERRRKERGAV